MLNILKLDLQKLNSSLDDIYIKNKKEPILLMSSETLNLLKKSQGGCLPIMQLSIYGYNTYMGFKIALAEWLSLGEVDIR